MDRRNFDAESGRPDLRVCLPGRQLRHGERPERRPRGREGSRGGCQEMTVKGEAMHKPIQRGFRKSFVVLTPALAVALTSVVLLVQRSQAQRQPPAPFTAAQGEAGRAVYAANCSGCHGTDLGGGFESPQLAGSNFMRQWGDRSI